LDFCAFSLCLGTFDVLRLSRTLARTRYLPLAPQSTPYELTPYWNETVVGGAVKGQHFSIWQVIPTHLKNKSSVSMCAILPLSAELARKSANHWRLNARPGSTQIVAELIKSRADRVNRRPRANLCIQFTAPIN
jgi:hypothetical protein